MHLQGSLAGAHCTWFFIYRQGYAIFRPLRGTAKSVLIHRARILSKTKAHGCGQNACASVSFSVLTEISYREGNRLGAAWMQSTSSLLLHQNLFIPAVRSHHSVGPRAQFWTGCFSYQIYSFPHDFGFRLTRQPTEG